MMKKFRIYPVVMLSILITLSLMPNALAEAFSIDVTLSCVEDVIGKSPSLGDHSVMNCIGKSAQACMIKPGQDNTLGMISCLRNESDYWEKRMLEAYSVELSSAKKLDKEVPMYGQSNLNVENALKTLQAAWATYIDSLCLYEQSLWLGGSGSGPAVQACYMTETARQTLKLEGWWSQ